MPRVPTPWEKRHKASASEKNFKLIDCRIFRCRSQKCSVHLTAYLFLLTVPVSLFNSLSLLPITDVNECGSAGTNECDSKAQCTNIEGSYNCRCLNGYQGDGKNCSGTGSLYSTTYASYFLVILFSCDKIVSVIMVMVIVLIRDVAKIFQRGGFT